MAEKISELNRSEQEWLASQVALAAEIAKACGVGVEPGHPLDPPTLDTAWACWLAGHTRGEEDANPYINAFGVAFGAYLVNRLGLDWRVVHDRHGTELAVWGREGDVLVFPTNLVAKRYDNGVTTFFAAVAANAEESVTRVRAEISDRRRGRPKFLGGTDMS